MSTCSPTSKSLQTEKAVREAYGSALRRQHLKKLWSASSLVEKFFFTLGTTLVVFVWAVYSFSPSHHPSIVALFFPGTIALAASALRAERRAYAQEFAAYGQLLNKKRGEPSRLRYLNFLAQIQEQSQVDSQDLRGLIPALEARLSYRQSFFSKRPVLTLITAAIVMLLAALLGQAYIWTTGLGWLLLAGLAATWVAVYAFGREWMSFRPSEETRERELLSFLHQAVVDVSDNPSRESNMVD